MFKKLQHHSKSIYFVTISIFTALFVGTLFYYNQELLKKNQHVKTLTNAEEKIKQELTATNQELKTITSEDQYVKNQKQEAELLNIRDTYKQTISVYESILKLREAGGQTSKLDEKIAESLALLAEQNYASAEAILTVLQADVKKEEETLARKASTVTIAANIPVNNAPPSSGYSMQRVQTEVGDFQVAIVSADLGSTRVIVDTASDTDCRDNCPVLSLGDYVARNGAYAGINSSYFCPADYPSCAGKSNSFDLLVMGKSKQYHNSDNNVYSTNPLVVFGSGFVRFVVQGSGWGRDTGVDGVLMNYPMLVSGGQVTGAGGSDPKMGSKGPRGFVANKGNTVYIGVTYNATVGENSHVLKTLGMENALNLDSGGSTALWHGGYKAGPGRNIPNAILFVRK